MAVTACWRIRDGPAATCSAWLAPAVASSWTTCPRTRSRPAPRPTSTWSATPSPSRMSPSRMCSVPMWLWLRSRASSWASTPTRLARSVKRSNIGTRLPSAQPGKSTPRGSAPAGGVALDGQVDQAGDQVGVGQARGGPEHGEHALGGEAGDGVDLVEQDPAGRLLVEEVDPGEALAVQRLEGAQRQLPDLGPDRVGDLGGDLQLQRVVEVLGLEVVELVAGDDLADHAGLGAVVAQDPALQLAGG